LNSQIHVLSTLGSNSKKCQDAVLTLGSLSGVIYPHDFFDEKANSYLLKSASSTLINKLLDTLKNIAGVPSGAVKIMIKDVKCARLAAIILGKMTLSVERILAESNDDAISSLPKNIDSTEPKDYSRLPNTSYLKNLFEALMNTSLSKRLFIYIFRIFVYRFM
jgi:hypothetical protein